METSSNCRRNIGIMKNAVWDADEMANIQNKDRLLPSQPYFSKMYNGLNFFGDLERVLLKMVPPEPNWDIQLKDGMTYAVMGSDLNTLRLFQFLINMGCYRRVLELGTYIGVSAMYMAETGAHVSTVEMGEEFYHIACRNIRVNGFDSKIKVHCRNALEYLPKAVGKADFILIDCAKESYKELLELSLPILSPNGLILVDDVFFQGDTLNDVPTSEKGAGVLRMLDYAATLDDYEKVILPIGNGLLMVKSK